MLPSVRGANQEVESVLLQVSAVASTNAQYYLEKHNDDTPQRKLGHDVPEAETDVALEPPAPAVPQPGKFALAVLC